MPADRLTPEREAEIRARLEAATPGPWAWFGNTRSRQIYLATQGWGRYFVMQFDRWGMQGGQPRFRNWGDKKHGARPAGGVMESFAEMGAPADHNHEIVGFAHPDAALIANAPSDLAALLRELDLLRADATAALDAAARAPEDYAWIERRDEWAAFRGNGVTNLRLPGRIGEILAGTLKECIQRARAATEATNVD